MLVVMVLGLLPSLALAESVEPPPSEPNVVTVPEVMLRWNGTQLVGVNRDWLKGLEKGTLLHLEIPERTTSIARLYNFSDYVQDSIYSVDFTKAKNLTRLEMSAFMYCKNLTELTGFEELPLTEIPRQAFYECKKLEQMFDLSKMPLKTIGGSAFNTSGITGIVLPDGLKELGPDDAPPAEASGVRPIFGGCTKLAFIRTASTKEDASVLQALPNSLEVLGPGALKIIQNCPLYASLQEQGATIKLPASLTKVYHDGLSLGKNPNVFILFPDGWTASNNFSPRAFASYSNHVLVFPNVKTFNEGQAHFVNRFYVNSRVVDLTFAGTGQTEKKLYGASVQYVYDAAAERWRLDEGYTLPAAPDGTPEPAAGYRGGWVIDGTELTNTAKVQSAASANSDHMTATYVTHLIAPPTAIRFTVNGEPQGSEDVANQNERFVLTVPASADAPGKLGVALEHPLLKNADTAAGQPYVYFRYLWYDVKQGTMGGDRQSEPGFFHPWLDPADNRAKARETSEITIAPKDERVYKDVHNLSGTAYNYNHYLVKVFGYYVGETGKERPFYESYCPAVVFGGPLDSLGHTTLDVYGCQVKVGPLVVQRTVTYDLDGGVDTGKYAPVTVKAGDTIHAAEAPTKDGYAFTGWSDGKTTHQAGEEIIVDNDLTLTAQWEKKAPLVIQHTVTYDLDGGVDTGKYAPVTVKAGDTIHAADAPTKDGYTFTGWSDGKTTHQPGEKITVNDDLILTAQWEKKAPLVVQHTVTYNLDGGVDTGKYAPVTVKAGDVIHAADAPTKDGYTFTGWSDGKETYKEGEEITVNDDLTLTAQWEKKTTTGGGTSISNDCVLRFESNGGTVFKDERHAKNTVVTLRHLPTRDGYTFTGWYSDEALTERLTSVKMDRSKTVYAGWKLSDVPDWLDGDTHFAYVGGYEDGTVRPMNNISRAEVAAIFFRLLDKDVRNGSLTTTHAFDDVASDMWCNTDIASMAKLGILKGRSTTHFEPNASITRAEFAAICARFDTSTTSVASNFTDIADHWAKADIERAATLGWIRGYDDGSFHPDQSITRAEAMTMINRVLKRLPETDADLLDGMKTWPDNPPGTWYYLMVQEATNSHEYVRKDDVYEHWTKLIDAADWLDR